MSKLLIVKARCGNLGGDTDLIQHLQAGRDRLARLREGGRGPGKTDR